MSDEKDKRKRKGAKKDTTGGDSAALIQLMATNIVFQVAGQPDYLDRTKPDRDRFSERLKPQITKDHIKNLLRRGGDFLRSDLAPSNIFRMTLPSVSVPIGLGEPNWHPGRDRPGSGGGGPDASDDPSDLVYLDMSLEELTELLALLFDLPFLLAKDEDKILAFTVKIRGVNKTGPEARLDAEATFIARLERFKAVYQAHPEQFPGLDDDELPTVEQFPFDDVDLRYKRVDEQWDPDSKAVVFFMFDTSGSMSGEPMAIARFYFLLNLLWLKSRYAEVDVVLIPHNASAFRVQTEAEFFRIDAGGGTMFSPAYELAMEIAANEYPADVYNIYGLHATDGYNFEPPHMLAGVIERMVTAGAGNFNYFGYLEIDPSGYGYGTTAGMASINALSDAARARVGAAIVHSQDEVPDAMREILAKDTTSQGGS